MKQSTFLPDSLLAGPKNLNLYHLHELFRHSASMVSERVQDEMGFHLPITAGMWGGSYLVANKLGVSRTNVVRLYSLVNLPQDTPLDQKESFDQFVKIYHEIFQQNFNTYGLDMVDPHWGEPIPYTNKVRPTTTLQMWDRSGRVKFVRAFFVWNQATWAESIIYDTIRNIKVIKELLNIDQRPMKKEPDELKFLLQDVLIIYFTLEPVLNPDFVEHAQPIINDLFNDFVGGLHDPEAIDDHYRRVFSNALVYGYEEALETHYKNDGLDIRKIEEWPVEKINWVPESLKQTLALSLENKFREFAKNSQMQEKESIN